MKRYFETNLATDFPSGFTPAASPLNVTYDGAGFLYTFNDECGTADWTTVPRIVNGAIVPGASGYTDAQSFHITLGFKVGRMEVDYEFVAPGGSTGQYPWFAPILRPPTIPFGGGAPGYMYIAHPRFSRRAVEDWRCQWGDEDSVDPGASDLWGDVDLVENSSATRANFTRRDYDTLLAVDTRHTIVMEYNGNTLTITNPDGSVDTFMDAHIDEANAGQLIVQINYDPTDEGGIGILKIHSIKCWPQTRVKV